MGDPRAIAPARLLRARLALAVAALVAAGMAAAWGTGFLDSLEGQTVDVRFDVRGSEPPPPGLVVVAIDADTFTELGLRWPFRRSLHAQVIDRLSADGARVIAYDVQFTEPSEPGEEGEDDALISAVDRADGVVLATTEADDEGHANVFGGDDVVAAIGARVGNSLLAPDPGAVIRRLPFEVEGLSSFPIAVAEVALDRALSPAEAGGDDEPWIDYAGPPGTIPSVSFSRVLAGDFEPGTFRDRIAVVGPVAPSLQDVHPTSTTGQGTLMSGPEIVANAIATALAGFPLRDASGWLDLLLIVLLSFAVPLAGILLGVRWVLAIGLTLAGLYLVGAQLAFHGGTVLSLVYELGAVVLSVIGMLGVLTTVEAFERARVRAVFARFVPDRVVDAVLARADDDLRLAGERLDGTVVFADLRGFTAYAESIAAEDVIRVLNRYLEGMTGAVHAHGGTVVSFMGDGIMAVFGAPIEQADHADRAVAAAREMLVERLPGFNAWLAAEGLGGPFRLGVGVCSGPLMSGTVGSDRRLEYAAVGTTTNTASRLEQLTKELGTPVLLADSTRAALIVEAGRVVEVGQHLLRGSARPVRLWTLGDGVPETGEAGAAERPPPTLDP
jgi:adenylate cyclase